MWRRKFYNYEVNKFYFVQEPATVAAADEAAEATAEPVAGPSGLCGQRLDLAQSPDMTFADAMEEVCTI